MPYEDCGDPTCNGVCGTWTEGRMTTFPCFMHCGKPACVKLGCIRVYNDRASRDQQPIRANPKLDQDGWPKRWSDPTYRGDGPWGA